MFQQQLEELGRMLASVTKQFKELERLTQLTLQTTPTEKQMMFLSLRGHPREELLGYTRIECHRLIGRYKKAEGLVDEVV